MLAFLKENLSTIIIGLIVLAVVVSLVVKLIRDKKKANPPVAAVVNTVLLQRYAIKSEFLKGEI